jgi:hypothetical protein
MYNNEGYSGNIINLIPNIENKTYLELGIADNTNFNGILAKNKTSVDTNGRATFTGTTDQYFASIDSNILFDIIFIDANHNYEYVLRDFNNSIKHCKEWLVLHDMIPPKKSDTAYTACSDSYKLLYFLLKEQKHISLYSLYDLIYFGLTFIKMPTNTAYPAKHYELTSYEDFIQEINKHKLYSKQEITLILQNYI